MTRASDDYLNNAQVLEFNLDRPVLARREVRHALTLLRHPPLRTLFTVHLAYCCGVAALYFELRRNGQPVDPSSWLQRR